ncbi:hypothetical protein [uncultured Desulfobacter sp.]|uniref:hypothetical protein n=1 Tax=uncultured Desulfobacter sp. TaxID=240139 RepID=UPI0029F55125|nr:hypothetical protein [uncultured Desulfobacter sp.]
MGNDNEMGAVVEVIITLDNGEELVGNINMRDYKRFSDYIEDHDNNHIKLFQAKKNKGTITGGLKKFLLIPKSKICMYEPFE